MAATSGSHEPPTDSEIADKVTEFLATEGVTAETLDEAPCGDDTCYHVQVTVSSEALLQHYLDSMGDGMGDGGGHEPLRRRDRDGSR